MADAPPTLPAWWPEAAVSLATAIAARLGWLLRSERSQKAADRRSAGAASVLAEIETHQPAYQLPTPWLSQVRTEAAAVSAAQMRAHEDAIRPRTLELDRLGPRVDALEDGRDRTNAAIDRLSDQLLEHRQHFDARLDRLADALSCRACGA